MSRSNDYNQPPHEIELSPDDRRLLDELAAAGFNRIALGQRTPAENRRLDVLVAMFGLMNDYPVDDADDTLIHATMARIKRHEQEKVARMAFDARQDAGAGSAKATSIGFGGRRIRIPDFITVAAVILIGVSVLWPVLSSVRQKSIDEACANNLRQLGYAFGNYAADNGGALPIAQAGMPSSWDSVRHVLNLQPLVEGGYCEHGHLNCAGHEHNSNGMPSGPSYSYRWFVPGSHLGWQTAPRVTVVLGDLNPMIDAARAGSTLPPLTMSVNHAGRGQNVLTSDGATMWLEQPLVGRHDNIWLPHGADHLRSGVRPDDPMDVFLAH